MQIFYGTIFGADEISRTAPFLETFATARGSAAAVFDIIDRKSKIDPLLSGSEVSSVQTRGDVELKNVFFNYPSRLDLKVINCYQIDTCHIRTSSTK